MNSSKTLVRGVPKLLPPSQCGSPQVLVPTLSTSSVKWCTAAHDLHLTVVIYPRLPFTVFDLFAPLAQIPFTLGWLNLFIAGLTSQWGQALPRALKPSQDCLCCSTPESFQCVIHNLGNGLGHAPLRRSCTLRFSQSWCCKFLKVANLC